MKSRVTQAENIASLVRLVKRATEAKRFAFMVASCDSLPDQNRYLQELRDQCAAVGATLITLELWNRPPLKNFRLTIQDHLRHGFPQGLPPKLAIQVTGLEVSMYLNPDDPLPDVLRTLNAEREHYRTELPYPILLWLPEYAIAKLAEAAPDFWAMRTQRVTFFAQPTLNELTDAITHFEKYIVLRQRQKQETARLNAMRIGNRARINQKQQWLNRFWRTAPTAVTMFQHLGDREQTIGRSLTDRPVQIDENRVTQKHRWLEASWQSIQTIVSVFQDMGKRDHLFGQGIVVRDVRVESIRVYQKQRWLNAQWPRMHARWTGLQDLQSRDWMFGQTTFDRPGRVDMNRIGNKQRWLRASWQAGPRRAIVPLPAPSVQVDGSRIGDKHRWLQVSWHSVQSGAIFHALQKRQMDADQVAWKHQCLRVSWQGRPAALRVVGQSLFDRSIQMDGRRIGDKHRWLRVSWHSVQSEGIVHALQKRQMDADQVAWKQQCLRASWQGRPAALRVVGQSLFDRSIQVDGSRIGDKHRWLRASWQAGPRRAIVPLPETSVQVDGSLLEHKHRWLRVSWHSVQSEGIVHALQKRQMDADQVAWKQQCLWASWQGRPAALRGVGKSLFDRSIQMDGSRIGDKHRWLQVSWHSVQSGAIFHALQKRQMDAEQVAWKQQCLWADRQGRPAALRGVGQSLFDRSIQVDGSRIGDKHRWLQVSWHSVQSEGIVHALQKRPMDAEQVAWKHQCLRVSWQGRPAALRVVGQSLFDRSIQMDGSRIGDKHRWLRVSWQTGQLRASVPLPAPSVQVDGSLLEHKQNWLRVSWHSVQSEGIVQALQKRQVDAEQVIWKQQLFRVSWQGRPAAQRRLSGQSLVDRSVRMDVSQVFQKHQRLSTSWQNAPQLPIVPFLRRDRRFERDLTRRAGLLDAGRVLQKQQWLSESWQILEARDRVFGGGLANRDARIAPGRVFLKIQWFDEGWRRVRESLGRTWEHEEETEHINEFCHQGQRYYEGGDYEQAISWYQRALRLSQWIGDKPAIQGQLIQLGNVWQSWKKHEQAVAYYIKAYPLVARRNNRIICFTVLENIVNLYGSEVLNNKELQSRWAETFFEHLRTTLDSISQLYGIGTFLKLCAHLDFHHEQFSWFVELEMMVKKLLHQMTHADGQIVCYRLLTEICRGLGHVQREQEYQQRLEELMRFWRFHIWLDPGVVETQRSLLTLNIHQAYTFHLQFTSKTPESSWFLKHIPTVSAPLLCLAMQPTSSANATATASEIKVVVRVSGEALRCDAAETVLFLPKVQPSGRIDLTVTPESPGRHQMNVQLMTEDGALYDEFTIPIQAWDIFSFETVTINTHGEITQRQSEWARQYVEHLGDDLALEMAYIPGGTFLMGSLAGEGYPNERPQHEVRISPFLMGKFPSTQQQWECLMGTNPSYFKEARFPVERVSWHDAVEFCERLSKKTSHTYRLPTEAEWEYACRAGTTTPFSCGPTLTIEFANYSGIFPYGSEPVGIERGKSIEVGSFLPNAFGLYDMHGNVWEWCADPWHENYEGAPTDGRVWDEDGDTAYRVLRGGSWVLYPRFCRSPNRDRSHPDTRNHDIGMRVVMSLPKTLL